MTGIGQSQRLPVIVAAVAATLSLFLSTAQGKEEFKGKIARSSTERRHLAGQL
jgi:hypothetical protein